MKPKKHGAFHQKHSLGQNFIEDEALLNRLADLSLMTKEDCALEIGSGFGALTKPLADRAKQVVSLEIDKTLIPILNVTLEHHQNVRVVCGDVMRTNLTEFVRSEFGDACTSLRVAANLPYYITTDVLTKLMQELPQAKSIAVMIQKEVGDKLLSQPREEGYGPLAVLAQYHYEITRALDVPAACFNPPPKVDSSFMLLERLNEPRFDAGDETVFIRLVRGAFLMRRKTLMNNLVSSFSLSREQAGEYLEKAGIPLQARAEELSLEQFCMLSRQLN